MESIKSTQEEFDECLAMAPQVQRILMATGMSQAQVVLVLSILLESLCHVPGISKEEQATRRSLEKEIRTRYHQFVVCNRSKFSDVARA